MYRTLFTAGLLALSLTSASAENAWIEYRPGVLKERLKAGETLILNFQTSWSLTSQNQAEVLAAQKADNPDYLSNITFVAVDWDTYGPSQMAERRKIKRHGTLIVLKGSKELARLEAATSPREIKRLMDVALDAAQKG